MEIVLGTVQFGLIYGISTNGTRMSEGAVRDTLALAYQRGIRALDTAPLYGDIESRLASLCASLPFHIVSKIPPIPAELAPDAAADWALRSANLSLERLGANLQGLLFHRAEDLAGDGGSVLWQSVVDWGKTKNIAVGVSGYDPNLITSLCNAYEVRILQLPANALDQRFRNFGGSLTSRSLIQLRSAFLQGLMLLPVEVAVERVPAALAPLRRWHSWLQHHGLTPLEGALSIIKGFEHAHSCVIGVDNPSHLAEILDAWVIAQPMRADELAILDTQVIDPRLWGGT